MGVWCRMPPSHSLGLIMDTGVVLDVLARRPTGTLHDSMFGWVADVVGRIDPPPLADPSPCSSRQGCAAPASPASAEPALAPLSRQVITGQSRLNERPPSQMPIGASGHAWEFRVFEPVLQAPVISRFGPHPLVAAADAAPLAPSRRPCEAASSRWARQSTR